MTLHRDMLKLTCQIRRRVIRNIGKLTEVDEPRKNNGITETTLSANGRHY